MECPNTHYFKAVYVEGDQTTVYEQGEDDRSAFVEGKNAYYDIFYNPWKPLETLRRFELHPASGEGPIYAVDLVDGHFEINGVPFFQHNTIKPDKYGNPKGLILSNFRLIYFRITNANMTATMRRGNEVEITDRFLDVAGYLIGFQANDQDGQNHTHILRI